MTTTTQTTHTPGPWVIHEWGIGDSVIEVNGPDGAQIAEIDTLRESTETEHVRASGEHRANARLIAAAPDLLAACKAADGAFDRIEAQGADGDSEAWKMAFAAWQNVRAAIAKAERGVE